MSTGQPMSLITYVVALIAVMNPIGNAALYIGMVADRSKSKQHKTAIVCGIAVAIILIISLWVGGPALKLFGISIPAFEAAGGLIVTLIGLSMIRGGPMTHNHATAKGSEDDKAKDSIAVVPLAMPIVAGPGAISTIIAHANDFGSLTQRFELTGVMVLLGAMIAIILLIAPFLGRIFGEYGMRIITRVMGLILVSIAFQMLAGGLVGLFPGLGSAI